MPVKKFLTQNMEILLKASTEAEDVGDAFLNP